MKTILKNIYKSLPLILVGFVIGVVACYGFVWWQVYQRFNDVWTCQVFTGQLSIDEAEHCKRFKASREQ